MALHVLVLGSYISAWEAKRRARGIREARASDLGAPSGEEALETVVRGGGGTNELHGSGMHAGRARRRAPLD